MRPPWPLGLIRVLWLLYPAALRHEYCPRMEELLLHMWEGRVGRNGWASFLFWTRALADAAANGVAARVSGWLHAGAGRATAWGTALGRSKAGGLSGTLFDVRYGARRLRRNPGFSTVVTLTLALGIGASAAIFSIVHAVILEPLPYPDAERLVGVWHAATAQGSGEFWHAQISYQFYRSQNQVFDELGVYWNRNVNLAGGAAPPEWAHGTVVSASMLRVLGVGAQLGRTFTEEEELPGSAPTVVLDHGAWTRRFGADPSIVGRTIRVDGVPRTVIGVMPADFHFPNAGTELWLPMEMDPARPDRSYWNWRAVGRLKPGVDLEAAEADMNRLVERLPRAYPDPDHAAAVFRNMGLAVHVHPFKDDVVGAVSGTFGILLGCVGLILVIAWANVANLFLVRAEGRRRELAVRTALGAGRGAVIRTFLAESTVLSLVGGGLGIVLAYLAAPAILALAPERIPRADNVGIDAWVVGFTLAVSLLSGTLFGLVTGARRLPAPARALQEGGQRTSGGRGQRRLRSALVVAQLTLALVLMSGSGLLVRSYLKLSRVDPGFEPSGALMLQTPLPAARYTDPSTVVAFYEEVLRRIRAIPGVTAAGAMVGVPFSGEWEMLGHSFEDFPIPEDAHVPNYVTQHIVPGVLRSLQVPLIAGRYLDDRDLHEQTDAVLISEPLAIRLWPGQDPIGKRLTPGRPGDVAGWRTVVGVVGPVRYEELRLPPTEAIYYPLAPLRFAEDAEPIFPTTLSLVVRTTVPPTSLARSVSDVVWAVDPDVPVANVRSLEDVVASANARLAFTTVLLLVGAGMALVLGVIGLYGVIAYLVRQRTREIGIRMALGSTRQGVTAMVLGEGMGIMALGTGLGLVGAVVLTRFLRALLFEVSSLDFVTLGGVAVLLIVTSLAATLLPAWRAARVDPVTALREG